MWYSSMAAGEQREELRVSKRRGTIHLPSHWPLSLPSNISIIAFSIVPFSSASMLSGHSVTTYHTSVFLGLQLPETIPHKTSVTLCPSTGSCEWHSQWAKAESSSFGMNHHSEISRPLDQWDANPLTVSVLTVPSQVVTFPLSSSLPSSEEYKLIDNKQSRGNGSNDQAFSLVGEVAFQPLKYQHLLPLLSLTVLLLPSGLLTACTLSLCTNFCVSQVLARILSLLHYFLREGKNCFAAYWTWSLWAWWWLAEHGIKWEMMEFWNNEIGMWQIMMAYVCIFYQHILIPWLSFENTAFNVVLWGIFSMRRK